MDEALGFFFTITTATHQFLDLVTL